MKDATFPPDCLFITYNKYMEPEIAVHGTGYIGYNNARYVVKAVPTRVMAHITRDGYETDGITLKLT